MSEELYFNNELRKCLNAAGLSDCGENDQWNYWYQRVHKAHDQAIDRVTEVQRTENARLRELCERFVEYVSQDRCEGCVYKRRCDGGEIDECWQLTEIREIARDLGIEVK